MDKKTVGVECRIFRKKTLGMTAKELAEELNCSISNIYNFENGQHHSSRILLYLIERGLKL